MPKRSVLKIRVPKSKGGIIRRKTIVILNGSAQDINNKNLRQKMNIKLYGKDQAEKRKEGSLEKGV